MTKKLKWIKDRATNGFVHFSKSLRFEQALLHEKWVLSLAKGLDVGLVGLGHTGNMVGMFPIPPTNPSELHNISPHEDATAAVSMVRRGTMCFICAENGDLYVVLPNGATFVKTQGQWQYRNYLSFQQLLADHLSGDLAEHVLRCALDLSFDRKGALLCFPASSSSVPQFVPDYNREKRVNEPLRRAVTNLRIAEPSHRRILLAAAEVDGAIVFSPDGNVLDAACMIGEPTKAVLSAQGVLKLDRFSGARTTAAWNASFYGLSIKISEDGPITVFKTGRLIGQMG